VLGAFCSDLPAVRLIDPPSSPFYGIVNSDAGSGATDSGAAFGPSPFAGDDVFASDLLHYSPAGESPVGASHASSSAGGSLGSFTSEAVPGASPADAELSDAVFESALGANNATSNADLARFLLAGASSASGPASSSSTAAPAPVPAPGFSAPNPTAPANSAAVPNGAAAAPPFSLTNGEGLIVQMRPGQEGAFGGFASAIVAYHATATGTSIPGLYVLNGNPANLTALGTLLAGQPSVSYVEPNQQAHIAGGPSDPDYQNGDQYGLNGAYGINAPGAWSVETSSPNVTVAVIDTGIDYDHPDLYDNIWINQAEIPDQWYTKSTDGTYDKLVQKSQIVTATPGVITFTDLNKEPRQNNLPKVALRSLVV